MTPHYAPGRYECTITSHGFTKAKSSGNAQFVIKFSINGRMENGELFEVDPGERSIYRPITDNTMEYFMNDLESLGVTIASFSDLDPESPNHIPLKGITFDAFCSHKPDQNGDLRERWGVAQKAGGKPIESIPSSEVKSLDRLFGKHLKKAVVSQPKPVDRRTLNMDKPVPVSAGASRYNDSGIDESDIPF